jgi:hypothetical protein
MPGGAATDSARAQDNLLQLDPNDENFPGLMDCQDGQTVVFEKLVAEQVSPGEFKVLSAESVGPKGGEGESEGEGEMPMADEMGAMGKAKDTYPNPAVAGLA